MVRIKLKGMKQFIIFLGLAVPLLLAHSAGADMVTNGNGYDIRGIYLINYGYPSVGTEIDYTPSPPSGGVYSGVFNQGMIDPLGATASQVSSVTASAQSLFAQGSGQASCTITDTILCGSGTGWQLSFSTAVSSTYTLSGSLACGTPPLNWGPMTYVIFTNYLTTPIFFSDNPGNFAQSGTLSPGTYVIQAEATAEQSGASWWYGLQGS